MSDQAIEDLQREDEWDFEHAERQHAPRGARAVVSVSFKSQDFARVTAAAREGGQPTSQFIREAALARARYQHEASGAGVLAVQRQQVDSTSAIAIKQLIDRKAWGGSRTVAGRG